MLTGHNNSKLKPKTC